MDAVLGLFISIYGAGGSWLDPVGGQVAIVAAAIKRGWTARAIPYNYTDVNAIIETCVAFARANPSKPITIEGDSCGANVIQLLVAALKARGVAVRYVCFVQASFYCNRDSTGAQYPNIQDNCARARVIFSDWAHTGGLGVFVPQPESVPEKPIIVGGWQRVNDGKTLYRQDYVPAAHPDDQDPVVHQMLFADLDAIANEVRGAA